MSVGRIALRYARAFFLFSEDKKEEDKVYKEMEVLSDVVMKMPYLKHALVNPMLSDDDKVQLLITAAGGEGVSESTKHFLHFLIKQKREEYVQGIALSYCDIYRKAKHIVTGTLILAKEVNQEVINKVKKLINDNLNATTNLNIIIDEKVIGGFILEVENKRLDASVQGELNTIRKKLLAS